MQTSLGRSLTTRSRTHSADVYLGIFLTFIAGAINAGGFLAIGFYTSHMSGIVSSIADFLVLNQLTAALYGLLFITSFMGGAITSSFIVNLARTRDLSSEFALVMMLEALLLLAFGLSAAEVFPLVYISPNTTIALLCFIMGLQNALISKITKSKIRTTHVTGITTDIGIELGRLFSKWLPRSPRSRKAQPTKLLFLVAQLLAFLAGGIAGALSFKYMGFLTTVPLALFLGTIAFLPILDDIRKTKIL